MTIEEGKLKDWDDRYPDDTPVTEQTRREAMADIIDLGIENGADGSEIARVLIGNGF